MVYDYIIIADYDDVCGLDGKLGWESFRNIEKLLQLYITNAIVMKPGIGNEKLVLLQTNKREQEVIGLKCTQYQHETSELGHD